MKLPHAGRVSRRVCYIGAGDMMNAKVNTTWNGI